MTNRGIILAFSGIDGSGKTTIAKMLIERLESSGLSVRYSWCRHESPMLFTFIGILKRMNEKRSGQSSRDYRYSNLKQRLLKLVPIRLAYELFVLIDYALEIQRRVAPRCNPYDVAVVDRYVLDVAADVMAECSLESDKAGAFLRALSGLVPTPSITFLFLVPAQVSLDRKDDIVGPDYLERRLDAYKTLSPRMTLHVIDGTQSIDVLLSIVVDLSRHALPQEWIDLEGA